jgi:hypothetical protein
MLSIAQQFASLLNEVRFDEAAELLVEDCAYHYSEGNYAGRKNVINIYRRNQKYLTDTFEEVKFGSVVEPMDGGRCQITYYDNVRAGDKWHEMKSYDILQFKDGLIADIHNHEIPGESEAFMAFWRSTRPAAA